MSQLQAMEELAASSLVCTTLMANQIGLIFKLDSAFMRLHQFIYFLLHKTNLVFP